MRLPHKSLAVGTALLLALGAATPALAQEGTFTTTSMTPDTAVKLAQAALQACRDQGYQVAVAVIDRGGNLQALIRDRYAGPHTPETARRKAWTALSFRTNTSSLADATQPGAAQSGMRDVPGALALGGGVMVEAGGSFIGGVGVSGAPGGSLDEACAQAGIDAVAGDLM